MKLGHRRLLRSQMRRSTDRGAYGIMLPSRSKQSWITCAVGSVSHGTTASVEKSGSRWMSWSALSFWKVSSSRGQSPVMVWVKIEPGIAMDGPARNFCTGIILPRATPAWSGTIHSMSSMSRAEIHASASSNDATPRIRSDTDGVFLLRATFHPWCRPTAGMASSRSVRQRSNSRAVIFARNRQGRQPHRNCVCL